MKTEPLVSIVVLSYNFGDFMDECLQSIMDLDGQYDTELIVIDDASTDNSHAVINKYRSQIDIHIVNEQNLGHCKTVEKGLRLARGKYIARLDGDDRYKPSFLSQTVPLLNQYEKVGLVYGRFDMIDQNGRLLEEAVKHPFYRKNKISNELIPLAKRNYICSPTVIARRECWLNALPVPHHLSFHDWYFTLNMAVKHDFYYLDQILADYRLHSSNMHSYITYQKKEEPSVFWILKHIVFDQKDQPLNYFQKKKILSENYKVLADKYFGQDLNEDARRCYLCSIYHSPLAFMDLGLIRRFLATFIPRKVYNRFKKQLLARGPSS